VSNELKKFCEDQGLNKKVIVYTGIFKRKT